MSKCRNMSDLEKYPSRCTEYQERISSEEQKLKHVAITKLKMSPSSTACCKWGRIIL